MNGDFQTVMELFDDMSHVAGCRQSRQQNAELVAAEPRDHVWREQRAAQAQAGLQQQVVAAIMTERVVDILETVKVQEQQGNGALFALPVHYCFLHQFTETDAIRQIGDRVGIGQTMDGFVRLPAFLPAVRLAQLAFDCGHQSLQGCLSGYSHVRLPSWRSPRDLHLWCRRR